jgi:hypothetical protein
VSETENLATGDIFSYMNIFTKEHNDIDSFTLTIYDPNSDQEYVKTVKVKSY